MLAREKKGTIKRQLKKTNCLDKFPKYISLCIYYHLNRCKNNVDCSMCTFILDLQYLYTESLVNGGNGGIFKNIVGSTTDNVWVTSHNNNRKACVTKKIRKC